MKHKLHLEIVIDICDEILNFGPQKELRIKKIKEFSAEAESLLATQRSIETTNAEEENESYWFESAAGMIVTRKKKF